jgi:hypothetical protein
MMTTNEQHSPPGAPQLDWTLSIERGERWLRPARRTGLCLLIALIAWLAIGTRAASSRFVQPVFWMLIAALTVCFLVVYLCEAAQCFLDPRTFGAWFSAQPVPEFTGALEHAVWRAYQFVVGLAAFFVAVIVQSDFEAARSVASSDADVNRALFDMLEHLATAVLLAALAIPPVWFWRVIRRARATLPAQGVRLPHLVSAWIGLWIAIGIATSPLM